MNAIHYYSCTRIVNLTKYPESVIPCAKDNLILNGATNMQKWVCRGFPLTSHSTF